MTFLYNDLQFLREIEKIAQQAEKPAEKGYKGEGVLGREEGLQLGKKLIERLINNYDTSKEDNKSSNNKSSKDKKELQENAPGKEDNAQRKSSGDQWTDKVKSKEGQVAFQKLLTGMPFVEGKIDINQIKKFSISLQYFFTTYSSIIQSDPDIKDSLNYDGIYADLVDMSNNLNTYLQNVSYKPTLENGFYYRQGQEQSVASQIGGTTQFAARILEFAKDLVSSTTHTLEEMNRSPLLAQLKDQLQEQISLGQNYERSMETSIYFLQHRSGNT